MANIYYSKYNSPSDYLSASVSAQKWMLWNCQSEENSFKKPREQNKECLVSASLMQELEGIMKFPGNEFRVARTSSHNSELNFGTPFCRLWITPKCYTASHLEEKNNL